MRTYNCQRCGHDIDFAASRCATCGAELGFRPEGDDFVTLGPAALTADDPGFWRCLNAAWGCNWIVNADSGEIWCRSCRLTRGRPDTGRPDAIAAWEVAERIKRRLVRQLIVLGLPIEVPRHPMIAGDPDPRSGDEPDGVVFDLVHLPDNPGMTGHRPGTITLDLREVDDRYRDRVRASLGEAERTVIGHLRHEVGHHYWRVLVDAPGDHARFRALFGDERTDYQNALDAHYRRPAGPAPASHITHYATSHPAEDWAETFAHYLTICDGLDTVAARSPHSRTEGVAGAGQVPSWLERWRALSETVNAVTVGLGHPPPYPYQITEPVSAKLLYIHDRALTEVRRSRTIS
jgi:hypothetical protein